MKSYVEDKGDKVLSPEERNLLSVAYKNVIGSRRSAWRILKSLQVKAESEKAKAEVLKEYISKIEAEVGDICDEVIVSTCVIVYCGEPP